MSVETEIRRAVDTGKTEFGSNKALEYSKVGTAKAIICAKNLEKDIQERIISYAKISNTPVYVAKLSRKELGEVCGKPFNIGAISILDAGHSKILEEIKAAE